VLNKELAPSPTATSAKARKSLYPLPQGEKREHGYTPETLRRAKRLRREMTPQEKLLWRQLRDRRLDGFKFRDQQPIGPFIADFVCQKQKLIIEADGSQHADSVHDARRDEFLKSKGYRVMRFWNNEITGNLNAVLDLIKMALSQNPSPLEGEGGSHAVAEGRGGAERRAASVRTLSVELKPADCSAPAPSPSLPPLAFPSPSRGEGF
jgi:very-short-patch-repair endonuclease